MHIDKSIVQDAMGTIQSLGEITMKTIEMHEAAVTKCCELERIVSAKSGNKNPDYYKTLREYKLWTIIEAILLDTTSEEVHLGEVPEQFFKECSMGIKKGVTIEVHEGDNALDLLAKYDGVKDIWNKILKACDDAGLKIKGSDIVRK